jgi:hypothetical protein
LHFNKQILGKYRLNQAQTPDKAQKTFLEN